MFQKMFQSTVWEGYTSTNGAGYFKNISHLITIINRIVESDNVNKYTL